MRACAQADRSALSSASRAALAAFIGRNISIARLAAVTSSGAPRVAMTVNSSTWPRGESQTAVKAFRRRAPRNKQGAAMRSASVAEYDIADVRPLSRNGRA
jgi:hypothetical protein